MGSMSRNKGKVGERELALLLTTLTGHEVKRRVRNLAGEDDLVGLPGWSIECKRYAAITPALLTGWWVQACEQARRIEARPVLFFRVDRGEWRARWSASLHAVYAAHELTEAHTVEADPVTWWRLVQPLSFH